MSVIRKCELGSKDFFGFDNFIIFRPLDDSVDKSPIATPVATPSPPQSVMSLPTPEESEQEKVESEEKSPVETPEITLSIRDKTPEENPKDLDEDDLKE
jgi:hypothetical protein